MGTEQRESIFMLLELGGMKFPTVNRVARLAVVAELPAVKIGVAICATATHVREDKARVALRASYSHVHAAQWIARAIVVKLRNATDWFPTGARVAVFARNRDCAVRVSVVLLYLGLGGLLQHRQREERQENNPEQEYFPQDARPVLTV